MALPGAWGEIIVFIVKADAGKNRKRALGREDGWGQSSGGRSVREVVMAPPLHFGIDNHDEDDYGHHHCQDHRHYYQDFQHHQYQSVGSPISIMGPSFHSVHFLYFFGNLHSHITYCTLCSPYFLESLFTHHILRCTALLWCYHFFTTVLTTQAVSMSIWAKERKYGKFCFTDYWRFFIP